MTIKLEDCSDVLRPRQAAEVLGLGINATYEAIQRGEIPVIRIGRRLLVPKVGLQRMLDSAGVRAERESLILAVDRPGGTF